MRKHEPGQWYLLVKGIAVCNGYSDRIDASCAGWIAPDRYMYQTGDLLGVNERQDGR